MNKTPLIAIVILIAACSAFAQTAPDAAELTRLLNEFLAGASRGDASIHERFWANDLIYTRSAGRRVTKADVLRDVRNAPAPKPGDPTTVYTAEDIRIQQYGDTAIVAFRLVATTTDPAGTKQVANLLNSGTFVKRDGKWQVVNWQSTRMSRTDEETRADVGAAVDAFHQSLVADATKLSSVLERGFIWTTHDGQSINGRQLIDELTSRRLKFAKPDVSKQSISLWGDTAVVQGEFEPKKLAYTLTLANVPGGWKAIALHTSNRRD